MISNTMKSVISNNSIIRAMFEEGIRLSKIYGDENVFDYSIGNPNVEPPESIKKIINEILNEETPNYIHGYMNNSGYDDVRDDVSTFLNKKHDLTLSRNNIIMTCGAAGGLNIILRSILNPDDEVIAFAPYFGEYNHYVNNFCGKFVISPTNPETFEPDLEALSKIITSKTKALIINNPNNPTGVVYSNNK